jgi:hypothetical protein
MRRAFFLAAVAGVAACDRPPTPSSGSPAPHAEFLVSAGDSTFWVGSGSSGVRVRGSPILLARYDGRFYEIYITDDDRSYPNALFVGERLYRRDIISGDSTLVFADTTVPRIAASYARGHPDERRLAPDEETSEDPANSATAELEVVELFGPYASYEYHADIDLEGGKPWHTTRRGVIDLRTGRHASVADLVGPTAARRIAELGRRSFDAVRDSVRHRDTFDARGTRVLEAFGHLRFDETSFTITTVDGRPAIRFAITGRGEGPAGNSVELDPTPVDLGAWWGEIRGALPDSGGTDDSDRWTRTGYAVMARYPSDGEVVRVSIGDSHREWPVATMSAPIHRIDWLDSPPVDSVERRALGRAFDEAAAYDERAKVAAKVTRGPRFVLARAVPRARSSHPMRRR